MKKAKDLIMWSFSKRGERLWDENKFNDKIKCNKNITEAAKILEQVGQF